ncbi:non-functional NADPH-dependent codeinone reductase 2-like [Dioscorea cayenensis subsp. rotundata]|uniref:Non-functional NADPH-dependent codeinone reductase 2-like n=1 Tax=Dioscorea cayennensis subsp. rotundata TaxID=55577 RepID=A0AB40BKN9_DIOCR|nr:non-functional NADPH-dependent codeinone reductase 2-like [Dioscorea cayenensis subsp. rotundata]
MKLIETAIFEAMKLGYRHFDTASLYQSEHPLGQAISRAIRSGILSNCDELFITTKLAAADTYPGAVVPALRKSLSELGIKYVDLYLIHAPVRVKGEKRYVFTKEDVMPFDSKGTWEGMEQCYELGLAKSIGVCNFPIDKLKFLLSHAKIPPSVNQVEMHPLWQQNELIDFCRKNCIHVGAYSPLGGTGSFWGNRGVLHLKEIEEIARICLRWALERGVSVLPKSFNKERLKENKDIFGWRLSEDEVQIISLIPQLVGDDASHGLARPINQDINV